MKQHALGARQNRNAASAESVARTESGFKKVLTTPKLLAFGLAYINLMGIFTLYGVVTHMTHGMMALAFIVATIAMGFTALSYASMSRHYVASGSIYSYVSNTIAPVPAFMVGWVVLLDYIVLPLLNFLLIGLYMHQLFPAIDQWVYSMISILLIVALAIKGINQSAGISFLISTAGIVFILIFVGFMVAYITHDLNSSLLSMSGLYSPEAMGASEAGVSSILTTSAMLCLMFLGFDGITTFGEETKDPRRQIGRAIIVNIHVLCRDGSPQWAA